MGNQTSTWVLVFLKSCILILYAVTLYMHKDLKLYKEKVLKMEYGFDYILNQATKEGTFRVRPCQVTRTDRLSMSA